MADLDFEIEVRATPGGYELAVIGSPAGETRHQAVFPFDRLVLQNRLQALEIALLRSGDLRRRAPSSQEQTVQDFGRELFDWLIQGEVRSRYDVSRNQAHREGKALRIKLRTDSPTMAALPWEFLYDARRGDFVVLSATTPLVRYMEMPEPIEPLAVTAPLRMLAMIASPSDLPHLDAERERLRVNEATKILRERGLLEVHWLEGATWRALQTALRREPWHIFHFVGHGGFDRVADEGVIALVDDAGATYRLFASDLGRLLGDHRSLRLAVLNACEGARGSDHDLFSSTAATLLRRGTPAVVAMQYEITDTAAIEFSRAFYGAIADGSPVDQAMAESRKAVAMGIRDTLEWGTPVLFMRSPDGVLFRVLPTTSVARPTPANEAPSIEPTGAAVSSDASMRPPEGAASEAEAPAQDEIHLGIAASSEGLRPATQAVGLEGDVGSPPKTDGVTLAVTGQAVNRTA